MVIFLYLLCAIEGKFSNKDDYVYCTAPLCCAFDIRRKKNMPSFSIKLSTHSKAKVDKIKLAIDGALCHLTRWDHFKRLH